MKHILSALVQNQAGVLARVSGLFSARAYNIDSLTVGETEDPTVSRMTIIAHGDDPIIEQIRKQLGKLIDVIEVVDMTGEDTIDRELLLVKVSSNAKFRAELMQIVNTFRAKIVDVNPKSMTIEITGTESKLDAMLELLAAFGILELVRTGLISMSRKSSFGAEPKVVKSQKVTPKKVTNKKKVAKKKTTKK